VKVYDSLLVVYVGQVILYSLGPHAYVGVLYGSVLLRKPTGYFRSLVFKMVTHNFLLLRKLFYLFIPYKRCWIFRGIFIQGYRILLNLSGLAESNNQIQDATPVNQRTGTNIDFATQILDSNINTMSMTTSMDELSELELHPRGKNYSHLYPGRRQGYSHHQNSRYSQSASNTVETSEISTFSLGHWPFIIIIEFYLILKGCPICII